MHYPGSGLEIGRRTLSGPKTIARVFDGPRVTRKLPTAGFIYNSTGQGTTCNLTEHTPLTENDIPRRT